jgi:hypothetical protein
MTKMIYYPESQKWQKLGSAVLGHNPLQIRSWPEAYLLPAADYERLMDYFEDLEDASVVHERADGPFVKRDARRFIGRFQTSNHPP